MTLARVRSQRGAGGIGCLLIMAAVAVGVYGGFQYAMPKLRHTSFSDRLNESVPYFHRQPEDSIRRQIIDMAKDFDIALTPEQVKVFSTSNELRIDVTYEKVVDLKYWRKALPFELHRATRF